MLPSTIMIHHKFECHSSELGNIIAKWSGTLLQDLQLCLIGASTNGSTLPKATSVPWCIKAAGVLFRAIKGLRG